MRASGNGFLEIVNLLLENGADFGQKSLHGWTALHLAVYFQHSKIVKILLDSTINIHRVKQLQTTLSNLSGKGAYVNQLTTENGYSPFYLAAKLGNVEIAKTLISYRANIKQCSRGDYGFSPLHVAVKHGHLEMVKFLIDMGAQINKFSTENFSPLQIAASEGNLEIVKVLIEIGKAKVIQHFWNRFTSELETKKELMPQLLNLEMFQFFFLISCFLFLTCFSFCSVLSFYVVLLTLFGVELYQVPSV